MSVPQGLPLEVLDCAVVRDSVGLALDVRDWVDDPLTVLEAVVVFVDVILPVVVFEDLDVRVCWGLAVAVLVTAPVRVNATVGFIVLDGTGEGVVRALALAEYVEVVVLVEVLDKVPVAVGTIPRLRSRFTSSRTGGVAATRPIDNKIINQFMPIYYKLNVSFLCHY